MSTSLLCYSIILIFFVRLNNVKTACSGPACTTLKGISSITTSELMAADIYYKYREKFYLPEIMEGDVYSYQITDPSTLQHLEQGRVGQVDPGLTYLADLHRMIKKSTNWPEIFRKGIIKVHVPWSGVIYLGLETKTTKVKTGDLCAINVKLFDYTHPLMMDPLDSSLKLSDDEGNILLSEEEEVIFHCPGSEFELFNGDILSWKCFGESTFSIGSVHMKYRDIKCLSRDSPKEPDTTLVSGEFVDITGRKFKVSKNKYGTPHLNYFTIFREQEDSDNILFIEHQVSKAIKGGQLIDDNKRFQYSKTTSQMYPKILENYENTKQDGSIQQQLHGVPHGICIENNRFVPSQLIHPISLGYEALLPATLIDSNFAPQWKSIYENNWDTINRHVNKMASHNQKDLTVYTGTYENYRVRNRDDTNSKPLYLSYNIQDKKLIKGIPIKLYFFKIVTDKSLAAVFVTVNNPYIKAVPLFELCEEPHFPRLMTKAGCEWNPKYPYHGYSYVCKIDDFYGKSKFPFRNFNMRGNLMPVEVPYEIDDY